MLMNSNSEKPTLIFNETQDQNLTNNIDTNLYEMSDAGQSARIIRS